MKEELHLALWRAGVGISGGGNSIENFTWDLGDHEARRTAGQRDEKP